MRTLVGQKHLNKIASFIHPGTRVLEWGSGGSTVWLSTHLPEGATLLSIEHDPKWHAVVKRELGNAERVNAVLHPADGPLGANGTIAEEEQYSLWAYLHAADGLAFDVIFVDGYARAECMKIARGLLNPGGVIFLHDSQRDWYGSGKSQFNDWGYMGSCDDYPGPALWWGGIELSPPPPQAGLPMIVSFHTSDAHYTRAAQSLRESCQHLRLPHNIVTLQPFQDWESACNFKSLFIREQARLGAPILWLDADAKIYSAPELLRSCSADFAAWMGRGGLASGTVYFGATQAASELIDLWCRVCESNPQCWDQDNLRLAWTIYNKDHCLDTLRLPEHYCRVFDTKFSDGNAPVIEHFQASRSVRKQIHAPSPTFPTHVSTEHGMINGKEGEFNRDGVGIRYLKCE